MHPQSALAGLNSRAEAVRLKAGAVWKALKFGPRGAPAGEPGQVRKEAALSRYGRLRGITWMELEGRSAALARSVDAGCAPLFILRWRQFQVGTEAESHRVFSLKYRPTTFEEIVGQQHVRQTLVNTLLRHQVGHGYIFSGPRGVGKTTVARLFAKALNCAEGPGPKICNQCPACREITGGSSLDVIEMDGASNRKIEDVRALRENVRFAPTSGRYKIYIIDEVHMLTQEAFNALLKTLEEPPAHVVFILATTDPQKIPDTIHSRCQELEFHRLPPSDLEALLLKVCKKEKISIDPESAGRLAEWSDGSARDALVALEQASAFSEGDIREEVMDRLFGWVDRKTLESVLDAIFSEDRKKIFDLARHIEEGGKDIAHFLIQLSKELREKWQALVEGRSEAKTGAGAAGDSLLRMISALLDAERNLRGVRQPGLFLAIRLVDLIDFKRAVPLSDIVRRLEDMEYRMGMAADVMSSPMMAPARLPPPAGGGIAGTCGVSDADPDRGSGFAAKERPLAAVWSRLLEEMMASDVRAAAWLKEGRPLSSSSEHKILSVIYPHRFVLHQKRISAEKNNSAVDAVLSKLMGDPGWHVQAVLESSVDAPDTPPGTDSAVARAGKNMKGVPSKVRAASDLFESRGVTRRE